MAPAAAAIQCTSLLAAYGQETSERSLMRGGRSLAGGAVYTYESPYELPYESPFDLVQILRYESATISI
jgi:hypothetical protein